MKRSPGTISKNVGEYIAAFPKEVQLLLKDIRKTVKAAAPEAEELISYGMPGYKYLGMLVYFAAYKHHIGFYPGAGGIEKFKRELSVYYGAKGSVQFPIDRPLPLTLISKIVTFRVKQNEEKAAAKKHIKPQVKKS